MSQIAFLGLGVMGAPMAAHLARAGHHVTLYNRTTSRAAAWQARLEGEGLSARAAATPAEAAAGQDVVLSCLGNDNDLAEVRLGESGTPSLVCCPEPGEPGEPGTVRPWMISTPASWPP